MSKTPIESTSIKGNILSILSVIGSAAAILNAPDISSQVEISTIAGAVAAVFGNVMGIIGRVRATQPIVLKKREVTNAEGETTETEIVQVDGEDIDLDGDPHSPESRRERARQRANKDV